MDDIETKLLELYRTIGLQLNHCIEQESLTQKMTPNLFHWLRASLLEVNELEKRKETKYFLTDDQVFTIIESLRHLQRGDGDPNKTPLNDEEIDVLCEELNFS